MRYFIPAFVLSISFLTCPVQALEKKSKTYPGAMAGSTAATSDVPAVKPAGDASGIANGLAVSDVAAEEGGDAATGLVATEVVKPIAGLGSGARLVGADLTGAIAAPKLEDPALIPSGLNAGFTPTVFAPAKKIGRAHV